VDAQNRLVVSERRAQAMAQTADHYERLFSADPSLQKSREHFAMKEDTLPSAERRQQLTHFFFWTAWAASAERPDSHVTYTNNWPHEPLIDNVPSSENVVWSVVSVVVLLAGMGFLVWGWSFLGRHDESDPAVPAHDPLTRFALTPSQRALGKYLFLVVALFVFQVFIGGFTAHYTVEGQRSTASTCRSGSPTRSRAPGTSRRAVLDRHGLSGRRPVPGAHHQRRQGPKYQKLGVDILFWALVVVCVGSFVGNYLAIAHKLPPEWNFWLGHQGYEFVDLGRLWQIGKFVGILFWLVLMLRGVTPALLRKSGEDKNLLALLTASVGAIGLFYGAGLFYGERTNLSVMEYWRWWVVHLWVEGFFEVFATTALAFIFSSMGLVSRPWPPRPAWRRPRCSCWAAFRAPSTTCTSPAPPRP
jgi:nitric oxide reductase subunit B